LRLWAVIMVSMEAKRRENEGTDVELYLRKQAKPKIIKKNSFYWYGFSKRLLEFPLV
jgi:hypothetical protein